MNQRETATAHGNASRRIVEGLRAEILQDDYQPGSWIRQEDVAQRYGASRTSVREAFRTLEADGIVTLRANSGARVARLSLAECEEVYRVRERVEPLLLRYALPLLGSDDFDHFDDLAARMQASADVEQFMVLDREFHLGMYAPAQTAVLGELVHRLWNVTQHYRRAFTQLADEHTTRVVHDEHHMIATALRQRDSRGAEQALAGHIRRTRLSLGRHPELFDAD